MKAMSFIVPDIVLPGSNTASSARPVNRIAAGQNVLVIKTTKGVYIRTSDGKIFAVRSRADQQSIQNEISNQTTSSNRQVTTPTTTSKFFDLSCWKYYE